MEQRLYSVLWFILSISAFVQARSGSHSLWLFSSYITKETQFPQFSAVLMLDDVQVGFARYDPDTNQFITQPRGGLKKYIDDSFKHDVNIVLGDHYEDMVSFANAVGYRFNATEGIHVQQRISGCEFLKDGKTAQITVKEAYDGNYGYALKISKLHQSFHSEWPEVMFSKITTEVYEKRFKYLYLPICAKDLKNYMKIDTNLVRRKVRPRVRIFQKTLRDSGGPQVSCLATGFYPHHINMTLLRDGQPVAEQELTGGQLLPNGDGTYQMRRSVEVSQEELREKHNYTCSVTHLSLDNKLDISWEREPGPDTVTYTIIGFLVATTLIVSVVVFIMRRRSSGVQASPSHRYTSAMGTEEAVM